jgi:hypothetical protein
MHYIEKEANGTRLGILSPPFSYLSLFSLMAHPPAFGEWFDRPFAFLTSYPELNSQD